MTKFLFYSDTQLSGRTPRHRIDDYPNAMLRKIREVYDLAAAHNCNFVVFGGDFFDSHRVFNYDVIGGAMDIVCDAPIATFAVVGQHDIHGYNPSTFRTSTLAFFTRRCSSFEILWEPLEIRDVVLYPSHVWDELSEAMGDVSSSYWNVLVAHHLIAPKSAPYEVHLTKDIAENCPYDLVLSGDLHSGFKPHEINGTWFCNPGALSRGGMDEVKRKPSVAVITVDDEIEIEIINLKSALPGTEVFGESIAEIAREREGVDTTAFVEGMEKFEAESVDVYDLIEKVGRQEGISRDVLEYLVSLKKN